MIAPSVSLDLVHLLILKLVLHSIREISRDEDPSRSLWPLLSNYVSRATFYRKFSELELLGLVGRVSKGKYVISAGGCLLLLFAYLMGITAIDGDTAMEALRVLKGYWGLQGFSNDEVMSYIKLLHLSLGRNYGLIVISQEFPRNILMLLPSELKLGYGESLLELLMRHLRDEDDVIRAKRVIAKALIDYFPTTEVNGCEAVVMMVNNMRKVLAEHCGDHYELH
jgi:hypothetical protein